MVTIYLPNGEQLSNVTLLSETIQGAVYSAETEEGRTVIIKVAQARCLRGEMDRHYNSTKENLIQEIDILEYFESRPHKPKEIIQMIQTWDRINEEGEMVAKCVMMEYMAGGDLFDLGKEFWEEHRRDSPPQDKPDMSAWQTRCKNIFGQIVRTLSWMHDNGVAHLDLSPENFVLDEDRETVRFIDFGMSVRCETEEDFFVHGRRGKRPYAAPEVYGQLGAYDCRRADIFSAGAVLMFLVCGVADSRAGRPVLGKVMDGHLKAMLHNWHYDFVPNEAVELVNHMTKRDPDERIGMADLLNHPYVAVDERRSSATRPAMDRRPEISGDETVAFADLNGEGYVVSDDAIRVGGPHKPQTPRWYS